MKKKSDLLTIGEMAKRSGTSVSAIRFYADRELISSVRSTSGHRLFARANLRRVAFILIAQNLGYSLGHIGEVLDTLPGNRAPTKSDWELLSRRFEKELQQRIQQLQLLQQKLSSCIGCGCLSLRSCALYNPEDQATRFGTGPRYLLGNSPPSAS